MQELIDTQDVRWHAAVSPHLREPLAHATRVPGKLLRPRMLIAAYHSSGGTDNRIKRLAYAAELGHIGSLVHDDIIDADDTRRGIATVHRKFGLSAALLAGDAFFFSLFKVLSTEDLDTPDSRRRKAIEMFADLGIRLCAGEMLEHNSSLPKAKSIVFDLELTEEIARLKTAAFFECMCDVGAELAGADRELQNKLTEYGKQIGLAFQAADDLLSYVRTEDDTGKPATSDIRNGRPTFPVVHAFNASDSNDRSQLVQVFEDSSVTLSERWEAARTIVHRNNGVDLTLDYISQKCAQARHSLQSASVPSDSELFRIINETLRAIS